jgi:hypothetical protein
MNSNRFNKLTGRATSSRAFHVLGASRLVHMLGVFLALLCVGFVNAFAAGTGLRCIPIFAAGSFSDYAELEVLDHVFGGADYTRPATLYFALFSAAPSDAGGGTELTGNNYSRTAITNNATNFPAAAAGSKSNGTQINGPIFSGTTATVVAWGLFDASSAGNLIVWGDLAAGDQKAYANNDQPIIAVGSLTITLD